MHFQLDKNANYVDVKVVPKIEYQFQAVAREDKGPIVGIDWNKSPLTDFKTSIHNKAPPPPPPVVEQTVMAAPTSSSIKSSVDKPALNSNVGAASPTSETSKTETNSVLPMSVEVLAIVVVIGVAVLLVFVGVAYRLFCAKTGPVDEESCADDDHEDHDEDDDSDHEEKERLDSTNSS